MTSKKFYGLKLFVNLNLLSIWSAVLIEISNDMNSAFYADFSQLKMC